ncbi:glycosyltransferase family 2 protein [Candidatus Woesebacteria bacterium]|nr:glycosyltransferase family 2 protein [Candidatus Woesebacteria bacterium]
MLSIIIPFFNEAENLPPLLEGLTAQLDGTDKTHSHERKDYEIILVDDGSLDQYKPGIAAQLNSHHIHLFRHNRQMGKGQALNTGLAKARGDIVMFMDADLQDDPGDIPSFLRELVKGYDLINGVRFNRKDNVVIKLYSICARFVLQKFLHSPFTDINCGFKAFKRYVLDDVVLYGNNFRFFPLAVFYAGYRVGEMKVHNKPRLHGKSKFGMSKLFIGLIDMLTAFFLYKFAESPLHFFGPIGLFIFLPGAAITAWLGFMRIFYGELLYRRPLLHLGILMIVVGLQIVMTGIIGELIVYVNEKANKKN